MESQTRTKKIWKPPSFEDFNIVGPNKKIKLHTEAFVEEKTDVIPYEISEPKNVDELAIHPKKIEEVRNWLKWSLGEKAPILLVTGPAGSGKTITIKVSANAEGLSIKEWINPVDKTDYKAESALQLDNYEKFTFSETKQTDKFEEFIFRSSRYNSLFEEANSKIILIEDIPNIFVWKPASFHSFLEKYKLMGKSPIVFVITDDQNLNLHNSLFPSQIKNKFNVTNIKFNPVNLSSLVKNLKSLSDYYCPEKVSSQFLESICKNSNGDLRCATSDLLLFLRTNTGSSGELVKKPKKRLKKDNNGLWATTQSLSSKDCSFDFYQVLGRILYPKVLSEKERTECENKNQTFLHDVRKIAECWSNSFLGVLHENYLQTFGKFPDVVKGAETFSFCDVLERHQELEEYSSLVGVISLMSANTKPKKSGFKPIKKSVWLNPNKGGASLDNEEQFLKYQLSGRNLLLDLIPFLKILEGSDQCRSESSGSGTGGSSLEEKSEAESDEDIEIEEYDD